MRWALFPLEEGLLFPWDSGSNGVGRVRVPWGWRFRLVWCGAGLLDHRNTPENLREAVRRTISGSKGRLHFVDLGHTTRVLSWSLRPGTPASQHGFAGKKKRNNHRKASLVCSRDGSTWSWPLRGQIRWTGCLRSFLG